MKRRKEIALDSKVDKLTNFIENVKSGYRFTTEVALLAKSEVKKLTKRNGWQFDRTNELQPQTREVYKLTITNNSTVIQGVVSLEVKTDHAYLHLIESAPFNIH